MKLLQDANVTEMKFLQPLKECPVPFYENFSLIRLQIWLFLFHYNVLSLFLYEFKGLPKKGVRRIDLK